MKYIRMGKNKSFIFINLSLPYLDPTDPFFQNVGVALLNEVGCSLDFWFLKIKILHYSPKYRYSPNQRHFLSYVLIHHKYFTLQ